MLLMVSRCQAMRQVASGVEWSESVFPGHLQSRFTCRQCAINLRCSNYLLHSTPLTPLLPRAFMTDRDPNPPRNDLKRRGISGVEPSHGPLGEIQMARRRGQQKGHVHQQGKVWYVAYREDALDEHGKIVRIRRNERIADAKEVSKREAQRLAREILNRVDEQAQRPSSLVTVEEFVENRFKPDVVWALKHSGKLHYQNMLKHVIPAIGQVRVRDVNRDHVQRLARMKIDSGLSVQTALHIRHVIMAVFRHARLKRAYHVYNPVL